MINALIQKQNGGTLVWEFPGQMYKLENELQKIGIQQWSARIRLLDDEDNPVSVKLYAEEEIGQHLIPLFSEDDILEDVQNLTEAVRNANPLIREEFRQRIMDDQYSSREDLYQDIWQMTYDGGALTETFYFPLIGSMYDGEYEEELSVSKHELLWYEDDIRDALNRYLDRDTKNMAEYYDSAGAEKVLLADWKIERIGGELFGKVDVRLTEPLTETETASLKDWISGQNSDGLGEGFEQQEIRTDEGSLYVSFWNGSDDYFIFDQEEMDEYLSHQGLQIGGM